MDEQPIVGGAELATASNPEAGRSDGVAGAKVALLTGLSDGLLDAMWPDYETIRIDSESAMRVYDEKEFVPRVPRWLAESLVTSAGADGHGVVVRLWRRVENDLVMLPGSEAAVIGRLKELLPAVDIVHMTSEKDTKWSHAQVAAIEAAKATASEAAEARKVLRRERRALKAAAQ